MTDTSHIEQRARELLAAEMREHYPSTADRLLDHTLSPESFPLSTALAIRAIATALSARASAGEGGEVVNKLLDMGYVTDEEVLHAEICIERDHAYNCGVNAAIVGDCSCDLSKPRTASHVDFTAAPQPAQTQGWHVPTAGVVVSNGGVTWWDEVPEPGTSVYTRLLAAAPQSQEAPVQEPSAVAVLVTAVNAVLAANPNDDTMWSLEAAVAPFNVRKPDECANGCPPQQVCDYCQVVAKCATTPAHGDGEVVLPDLPEGQEYVEVYHDLAATGVVVERRPFCDCYTADQMREYARRAITTRPAPTAEDAGVDRDAARVVNIEVMRKVFDSLPVSHAKLAYATVKTYIDCCNAMAGKPSPFAALATETPQARGEGNGNG